MSLNNRTEDKEHNAYMNGYNDYALGNNYSINYLGVLLIAYLRGREDSILDYRDYTEDNSPLTEGQIYNLNH